LVNALEVVEETALQLREQERLDAEGEVALLRAVAAASEAAEQLENESRGRDD